jgi:hypothetical protein
MDTGAPEKALKITPRVANYMNFSLEHSTIHLPNKAMHNKYRKDTKRSKTPFMNLELLSYRDPETGDSIFEDIGLEKQDIDDFRKALELAWDNGEKDIKDCYALLLNKPFVGSNPESIFEKAV